MALVIAPDAEAIGRLLRYGLRPRLFPGREADYAALVARARSEPDFYAALVSLAAGAGLVVLDVDPLLGITLAADDRDSPFAFGLSDYARGKDENRLLHGLVHLAIAATAYPTAAALEEEAVVSLTVADVIETVTTLVERLRERHGPGDPPEDEPGLEPLYRYLGRQAVTGTTGDARAHQGTIKGAVRRALIFLRDQGLADVPNEASPDTFRLRSRYRIHLREAPLFIGTELDVIREELAR